MITHLVLRLFVSSTLGYDEAEQVVWSQTLAWGYGPQPPLYTWLLWSLVQVFGLQMCTLALLKTAILGATCLLLFLCARRIVGDLRLASLAAFSLLLMPLITWGSLKGSTHSDLLAVVCLASFWVFLKLLERGRVRHYLWLGLLAGLGVLSKYNYLLFVGTLLLAGLSMPAWRPRLLHRRLVLTFLVAFVVALPHALWAWDHRDLIGQYLAFKLRDGESLTYGAGVLAGLGSLVYRLGCLLPLPLAAWLVFFPQGFRNGGSRPNHERLLIRFYLCAAGLLLVLVAAGTTHFMARWLQPFLMLLPLAFFVRLAGQPVAAGRLRGFALLLLGLAVAATGLRGGQIWLGSPEGGYYQPRDRAFERAVAQLEKAGFQGGTVITWDSLTAANLRLAFPRTRLLCLDYPACEPSADGIPPACLLVWNAAHDDRVPVLRAYLAPHCPEPPSRATVLQIVEEMKTRGRSGQLGKLVRIGG